MEKGMEEKKRAARGRRTRVQRNPSPRPGGQTERSLRRSRPDTAAALTALSAEARRQHMTYGALRETLTEEECLAVVAAWQASHRPENAGDCRGCVYWRDLSATSPESGKGCHFLLDHGRGRRRENGRCLEYAGDGEKSAAQRRAWLGRRFGEDPR